MPLDPQLEPILEASAAMMELDTATIDAAMLRQYWEDSAPPIPLPDVSDISDHVVAGPDGDVAVRLYRPEAKGPHPAILFLHGGGWVLGTLDQYDRFARELMLASGCAVLSVGYRLAPEHPYPAAVDDSYAALLWLAENAERLGLDGSRLALAGDSAGGNLCAAIALVARDRAGPALRHQLLLYPATDRACSSASYRENDRYFLTPDMMRWYWQQYIGDRSALDTAYAAPSEFADLAGLPSATVLIAEYDPLRDEGEAYAKALENASVPTELVRAPGMVHGFLAMTGMVDAAGTWMAHVGRRLAEAMR